MAVKLELYRVFKEVAETGNISEAAKNLYISQSAVSQSVKQLETALQARLFARSPRRALFRETIYERVWGEEYPFGSRAVDLHVQRLRKKVGWEHLLQAVNKVGYRLEVDG